MSVKNPYGITDPGKSADQPAPVTWHVISQTEVTQPGPQGRLVSGHRVVFGLSTGQTGSVFLPDDQYTVPNVQAAIQARVGLIAAIGGLGGSSPGIPGK